MPTDTKLIVNMTRRATLCEAEVSGRGLRRIQPRGGDACPRRGCGLLLWEAPSIGAKLLCDPVDAVFLDVDGRVIALETPMRRRRLLGVRHAATVLVLLEGEAGHLAVRAGDQLAILEMNAAIALGYERGGGTRVRRGAAAPGPARPPAPPSVESPPAIAGGATERRHSAARNRPLSVLVISSDQRFRTTTSGLMTRRGCTVATTESAGVLRQYAARLRPDVVVIDADRRSRASTCAWVRNAVHPRQPGLVLVDDDPAGVDEAGGAQLVAKWGPAERLFEAIEAASAARVRAGGEQ